MANSAASKPVISNRITRRLLLEANGLAGSTSGALDSAELLTIIEKLGFVQLDTLRIVARAHDHILWSRNHNYRAPMLDSLLADDRQVFEHFTHDASVLPVSMYAYWNLQFQRIGKRMANSNWVARMPTATERRRLLERIEAEGPLCSREFDSAPREKEAGWNRPPHKFALDYYWYRGTLATAHRINFQKYYDLRERVIPKEHLEQSVPKQQQIDWLCRAALERLVVASPGQVQRFWDAASSKEVTAWIGANTKQLQTVTLKGSERQTVEAYAPEDIDERVAALKEPTNRMRIINPFDPLVRDRVRLKQLFDFDYRIEIFVPAAKRTYGYYVYPLLEGDRFVGRMEVRADMKNDILNVGKIWPEKNFSFSGARATRLESELRRLAKLAGVSRLSD